MAAQLFKHVTKVPEKSTTMYREKKKLMNKQCILKAKAVEKETWFCSLFMERVMCSTRYICDVLIGIKLALQVDYYKITVDAELLKHSTCTECVNSVCWTHFRGELLFALRTLISFCSCLIHRCQKKIESAILDETCSLKKNFRTS